MANVDIRIGYKDAAWFTTYAALPIKEGQLIYNEDTGDLFIGDGTTALSALTAINGGGGGLVDSVNGLIGVVLLGLTKILEVDNDANGNKLINLSDPDDPQDADTLAARNAAILTQRYVCGTNINSTVTGTSSETLISTVDMVIPANTMTTNSMLNIRALFNRVSAGGITTIKWGFNTAYQIAGIVAISNANMTAAVRGVELNFNVFTNNDLNSTKWNLAVSFSSATTNSNGVTGVGTIDWTVDQYLIITTTSAVSGETTTLSAVRVTIDKP